jgi:hypothetical protein
VRQALEQEQTLQAIEADAGSEQRKYGSAYRLLWLGRERAGLLREIVRELIMHGAEADVPDVHGITPKAYARNADRESLLHESTEG